MRQETIQLYQFKELSQKAKEKVLEKFRYINVDDDWCDFLYEDFKEELKRIGVECNTFYWSDDRDYHIYMDEARIINKEKFFKGILGNNYKKYKILKNLDNKDIDFEMKIEIINNINHITIWSYDLEDKKIEEILRGKNNDQPKNKMIVFIDDTDKFLDIEGNELGPFKKGDIANLSEEISNILIIDKKAEGVDED